MSQTPKLFRLQTYHGTQVFLDPQGKLRHGPIEDNPDNIRVQAADSQLVLWHDAGAAGFHGLGFPRTADGALIHPAEGQDGSEMVIGEPQIFDIEVAGSVIGLRHHETYVCSEPDGRVVLNRAEFGGWERFTLIEVEAAPTLPAVPLAEPVIEEPVIQDLTLDQLASDSRPAEPPTIEQSDHEPAPTEGWREQTVAEAEPYPPSVARAERLAASVASIRAIEMPGHDSPARAGLWRRFMRSLLGD